MKLEKLLPKGGPSINEVNKYIDKYKDDVIVIKCGGSCLLDQTLFNQLIEDIAIVNKLDLKVIIVHGGGKNIKKKLDNENLETKFIDGLRVTDEKTIKIVEEALLELNFEFLKHLNNYQANGYSINPKKNNVIKVNPLRKELGYVGSPKEINKDEILKSIYEKKIPIIVPMGIGEDGKIYNVNADVAAGSIAKELKVRRLLLMTDVEGVLDENKKLIPELNSKVAKKMLNEKIISGGMIPKINTCLNAVKDVKGVAIIDGRKPHSILFELFSDKGAGTLIRR